MLPPAPDVLDPLALVGADAPDADRARPRQRRVDLATLLPALDHEREGGAPEGGVPLPSTWAAVQAALGGVQPRDLYTYHRAEGAIGGGLVDAVESVEGAMQYGTHLPPGVHVLTGHTGGGKSALAINLAWGAIRGGHPVVYASLELDAEEVAARVLALEAGLPWAKLYLRRPLKQPADRQRRADAIATARAKVAGLFYVWAPEVGDSATAEDLRREVLAVWQEHGKAPLVIFDYLQAPGFAARPGEDGRQPLRERMGALTMQLRQLSRRLSDVPGWSGCPVVVLSITARANVRGDSAEPGMDGSCPDDLRHANLEALKALPKEAGEIEATSVTSWVLAIESVPSDPRAGTRLTLRLTKNRLGPVGHWVPFRFHGATGALQEDVERYREAAAADMEAATKREQKAAGRGDTNGGKPVATGGVLRGARQ